LGVDDCRRAVDSVQANALILHFNALQEATQPEGDTNFRDLLPRIEAVCQALDVPVIAKEVGWGFSVGDARRLADAGIACIDTAGAGGTSWSKVEAFRSPTDFHANVARAFDEWGIPTVQAIANVRQGAPGLPIIASGGLKNGLDVAKTIALGATLGGMAGPFLRAAATSAEAVDQVIREFAAQLRIAMFCTGSRSCPDLRQANYSQS
jgi:isopentenyl-diphosphate Delta-isomerase